MADSREGHGRDKQDRGLFASARKLARAAVTRAIERLTGMPLSGDPWATRGLLDVPTTGAQSAPPAPVPPPRASTPPPVAAVAAAAPAPKPATAAPAPKPAAAAPAPIRPAAAPVAPIAPASATTVKVAAPPVVPVAPARAGTVPGIGPTPPQPAATPTPPPAPPPRPTPIVMTPRAASAPRPSTGGLPVPAPGRPAPAPAPANGTPPNGTPKATAAAPAPAPTPPPVDESEQEPLGILDFEETPETYGIDEVAVIARDPRTLFVYWEVTPGAWDRARAALGGEGLLTLRLFVTASDGHGGSHDFTHDTRLTWDHGRRYLEAPARAARISVAVGLLGHDGRFVAMAYGPPTLVPSGSVAPDAAEEWMDVAPAGPPGSARVPPRIRAIGSAAEVAAQMAASSRAARRAAAQRAGAASAQGGRKGRLLPSGAFEFDEDATASSWPTSRSRAAGAAPGEDTFWPGGSSPGGSSFGGSSVTSPGKVQR